MSNLDDLAQALIAAAIGYNDGANKGFWRVQVRDADGKWMEMGKGLMANVLMPDGSTKNLSGVYIGPSDRSGYGRMLVKNEDGSFTTYEVSSHNARQFEAKISEADLKRQGIENTPGDQVGDKVVMESQKLEDMNPQPSTEEDIRLATVTPDEAQKKIVDEARAKSPLAQLPAGAEKTMTPEELAKATGSSEVAKEASAPDAVDEALAKLWNDANYADGANLDNVVDALKGPKKSEESKFITPKDVIGSSDVYALDEIKKGDYFYDTKTADILQATEDARWNADKTAVEVPAVDSTGADRTLEVSNNKAAIAKINYKAPSEKPVSEKSPAPVEDVTPSTNAPEMPDTATEVKVADVKEGDDLFTPSGTYLGKVSKTQGGIKDAMNKPAIRLHYTDETGKDYRTVYPLDAKFNVVSAPEKTTEPEKTPEAPAAPEVPSVPEAPAEPTPTEAPVKPANVPAAEMTMSQLIESVKSRMDKGDAAKGANPDYFNEARAILDDPNLTDSEKLSQVAHALRTTSLSNAQTGGQREATRSIMNTLRDAGVHEASKEYEDKLKEEARKKYEAESKTPVAERIAINPGQPDDGQPIEPTSKSNEEMYNLDVQEVHDQNGDLLPDINGEPIYDANPVINALMAENPNAKRTEDNGLVIERSTFTDHDGTKYNYEITVYPTFGGQLLERYTIKDLNGNVVEDFYHSDYKDSVKGLYGAKNGVMVFRDQLIGRSMPGKKSPTRETLSYFGTKKTLADRMRFFRGKGTTDPNSKAIKVRNIDENISYYLEGREAETNEVSKKARSAHVRGSRKQSFVASFYEAFDLKNRGLMRERLVQLLGRLPDNATSREKLISVLKKELTERYKGTDRASEIGLLVHSLDKWMATEGVDLRNLGKAPWVSTDGTTPVKVGDKVRAYGNENQTMIGIVTRLNKRTGGGGSYKDTVAIKFADGKVVNIFASRNVEILDEDHPDADMPLDNYEPWIRGDNMRKIRLGDEPAQPSEFLDFGPNDPTDPGVADSNAGTPYLGSDGVSGGSLAPSDSSAKAEDLTPGSAWHSEDGAYLGSVIEVVEVPADDGGEPGIAVVYVDADGIDQVEIVDKGTVRLPK